MVEISLERGVWSTFEKKETAYRASQIPGKLVVFSDVELPDLSTLHTVTGFLDLVHPPKDQVMPDLSLPPIANERWPVYFRSWTAYAGQDATPFPVLDKLPYTGARYIPLINKVYTNNRRIHRLMAESALSQMKNALLCFDYAPLLQARLPGGTLSEYRKFDALLRTILDKIVDSNDSRHHFLTLPMSMTPYSTSFIEPSFAQITASTIKAHTDPSFFFLVHLIGFLYAQEKPLSVKPFKKEVSLREAHNKDAAPLELISTSLFTRLDPSILDKINVVLYCGEKCIIYNLGALRQMALSTSGMYRRVLRHINIMKLSAGDDLAEHQMLTAEPDDVDQKVEEASPSHDTKTTEPPDVGVTTSPKTAPDNKDAPSEIVSDKSVSKVQDPADTDAPKSSVEKPIIRAFTPIKPVTSSVKQSPSKTIPTDTKPQRPTTYTTDPSTFVTHITTGLQDSVDRVETKDRDKLDKKTEHLLNQHMAVELGGKPLGHYAAHVEDPSVSSNALDFLKDKLPEPSQANGRITAFDPTYLKEMYHKDLANTLTALVNHGFFVKALEESPEVTHLTRVMHYKVSLVDINGKNHTIQFKLPMIDEMGYMYTDGVKTRMVIQEINKPICKISPTRVNLSSNFNKTLVEKHKSEKHTYQNWIASYLVSLRSEGLVTLTFGTFPLGAQVIPYEYAAISRKFTSVSFSGFSFTFDLLHRFSDLPKGIDEKTLVRYEESLGVYCGRDPQGHLLMWDMQDNIHQIDLKGNHIGTYGTFIDILDHAMTPLGYPPPPAVSEWVTLKILDIDIPMVYTLGYRFGLKSVLDDLGATYRVLDKSEKFTLANDEVAIPFSDSTLILNRYPFQAFLIGAGLLRYKTKSYPFLAFEDKDIYFKVFQDNGIKINYLRGIDDFFTYFLDPITLSVLEHIHEPTTVKGLLYRATQMLCTMNYLEASSAAHHRFRGAERSASTLYNELFRALADYNNRRGQNKSLSINPEAVFQRLRSDSTNVMVDTTNPIHEIKEISHVSFSGSGGRTSRAFVVNDRRFSKDSVGVLSEATPDSGKVAITAYTSIDPRIENIRGLLTPNENNETPLDATNILSVTGNILPGATQDDGKRANYGSIQMTHHVPNENSEVSPVRTGFERTIAHRVSDVFAHAAKADGIVESIDDSVGMMKIRYKDTKAQTSGQLPVEKPLKTVADKAHENGVPFGIIVPASKINHYLVGQTFSVTPKTNARVIERMRFSSIADVPDKVAVANAKDIEKDISSGKEDACYYVRLTPLDPIVPGEVEAVPFGVSHTTVSGSMLKQTVVPNVVVGEKIKRGDIVTYNKGFFTPDLYSKQVDWNHGIMATVALIEMSATLEDGCVISRDFGERMNMSPSHLRTITIQNDTAIYDIVSIGDHVETTDMLCVVQEGDLDIMGLSDDIETATRLAKLDRKAPKAKYPGVISDIVVYYACPKEKLHPSILKLVRAMEKTYRAKQEYAKGTSLDGKITAPGYVEPGLKYHGIEFVEGTVALEFIISEDISSESGDKLVVCSANKTIISEVLDKNMVTEDGKPVDVTFSSVSIMARIVSSPYIVGIAVPTHEKLRDVIVDDYFK